MKSISPWPSLLYSKKIPSQFNNLKEIINSISKTGIEHGLIVGDGKSTYNKFYNLLSWEDFKELALFIENEASKIWAEWNMDSHYPIKIHRSWCNIYPKDSFCVEHAHGGASVIAVLFIDQPEKGGEILFQDPLMQTWSSFPVMNEDMLWKSVPVSTGDILFFPSFLRHKTLTNTDSKDKIIISVNLTIDYFS
jgi:uncharacterized protein (TIGR02466 family)